jgi:8-oxo-dGTP pyrophosphatase MutT (NUDIX family)
MNQVARRKGVVVAMRRADGRWLMVRRSATVERAPLKVGFPGGEIEPGESHHQAIVRDMREELGVEVRPGELVWEVDLPDRPWTLFGYTAELITHDLRPAASEIAEVLWLTAEEGIAHVDGLATNKTFIPKLIEFLA